jgi:hypothetical protein
MKAPRKLAPQTEFGINLDDNIRSRIKLIRSMIVTGVFDDKLQGARKPISNEELLNLFIQVGSMRLVKVGMNEIARETGIVDTEL